MDLSPNRDFGADVRLATWTVLIEVDDRPVDGADLGGFFDFGAFSDSPRLGVARAEGLAAPVAGTLLATMPVVGLDDRAGRVDALRLFEWTPLLTGATPTPTGPRHRGRRPTRRGSPRCAAAG